VKPVAWTGYLNGLSMAAIKLASPGVPDTYQGNETWDFSLVDPDNRRPVDYARREAMLAELEALQPPLAPALGAMLASLEDGRAKMYVLWRMLQLRREREALFRAGGYTPVRATGELGRHLITFARRHEGECAIAVAPRLVATLGIRPRAVPCGTGVWGETRLDLGFLKDGAVLHDVFTLRTHVVEAGGLDIGRVLEHFPVSVLVAQ
jgi:(1->4)-alpha-D-glucan 1-alpha-D-glucosylmutase